MVGCSAHHGTLLFEHAHRLHFMGVFDPFHKNCSGLKWIALCRGWASGRLALGRSKTNLFLSTANCRGTPKMGGHFVSSLLPFLSLSLSVCLDFFNFNLGLSFFSFFLASLASFNSLHSRSFSFASFSFLSFFSFLASPILKAFFLDFPVEPFPPSSSSLELSSPRWAYLVSFSFSLFFSLSFFLALPRIVFSFLELPPPVSLSLKMKD